MSKTELTNHFGKVGSFYYDIVRGIDERPVNPTRERKSLAVERTLSEDLAGFEEISEVLEDIIDKFYERLVKADSFGRTITLKLKTHDFKIITRSRSMNSRITNKEEISDLAFELLKENMDAFSKIRLIGLSASNFEVEKLDRDIAQMKLFE